MPIPSNPWAKPLSIATAIAFGSAAMAATTGAGADADDPVATVAPIVVTATRTAETADETLTPVTVVTRDDIERLQANSVQDVLRGLPGLTFARNGGRAQSTETYLRGTTNSQVLVLIDGIRVGSATSGGFGFQQISLEQVERIEVVRGPRASLYGSDAIGGVIQIFTRRGGGDPVPHGRVGIGSRGARDASAGVSGGGDRGWFSLTADAAREDGFDVYAPREPDADGFRSTGGSARAGYRFENGLEAEGRVLRHESDSEYDGTFSNESEALQSVYAGTLSHSPIEGWRAALSAGRSKDDSGNFLDGEFKSRFVTRRDHATIQNDVDLGEEHLLTFGLDYVRDRVSGTTDYEVKERRNRAGFVQLLGKFGEHEAQIAARHDDNEQFGNANTGSIAWGWQLHDAFRLTASYGTAFKAPTFNNLYWPGSGNPDLEPEESKTFDLGAAGRHGPARWSVNVFRTEIENLIVFPPPDYRPKNVERAEIRGLEASLGTRALGFEAGASLTLLNPRNRTEGGNLIRRPSRSLRLEIDRPTDRFDLGATVYAESGRYDSGGAVRLGGFYTVDLRAEYRVSADWSVQGSIENLLDREYETIQDYNQPGRGVFLTLRYRP